MLAITTLTVALLASIVSATATAGGDAIVPGPLKGACRTGNFTTEKVDLDRWQGAWYEMAHSKSFYWYVFYEVVEKESALMHFMSLRLIDAALI